MKGDKKMTEVNKSYSRRLADYLAGIKYEEIPAEVIEQAKKLTLHVLAASIGSLSVEQSQKAIRMAQAKGGVPQSTIWGSNGVKVPIDDACFANGTMADVLDWEDCAWTGHPSAGVIPAALAIGEAKKINGKDYDGALAVLKEAADYAREFGNEEKAAEADKYSGMAYKTLGKTALANKDAATAFSNLKKAVEYTPNDGEAQFLLGRILLSSGKVDEAKAAFEVAAANGKADDVKKNLEKAFRKPELKERAARDIEFAGYTF